MNIFLVGCGAAGLSVESAAEAVGAATAELPWFEATPSTWSAIDGRLVLVHVSQPPRVRGNARFVVQDADGFSAFAGRPVVWSAPVPGRGHDDEVPGPPEADGRSGLDAATLAQTSLDRLDGRFALVTGVGRHAELKVTTDSLGAYPLYTAQAGNGRWVSNSAEVLRRLARTERDPRTDVLVSVLGLGWSLGGEPLWSGVTRLPAGTCVVDAEGVRVAPDGSRVDASVAAAFFVGRYRVREAAADLVAVTDALMDWPGRPIQVAVTGGRDSRVTFGAATRTRRTFEPRVLAFPHEAGFPDTADVRVARALTRRLGLGLTVDVPRSGADLLTVVRLGTALGGGVANLGDTGRGFPIDGPGLFEVNVTGQGGEIGRCFYGSGQVGPGELAELVLAKHSHAYPGSLLVPEARKALRARLEAWAEEQLDGGVRPSDLADWFYLDERMGSWAATVHGVFEHWADTTFPLWNRRLVPHLLAAPRGDRAVDGVHSDLVRELAFEVWGERFAGASPRWARRDGGRARHTVDRAARLARRATSELHRRALAVLPMGSRGSEIAAESAEVGRAQELVRGALSEAVAAGAPAAEVVDHHRVGQIVTAPAASLDARSRDQLWRLVTVLGPTTLAD